MLNGAQGYWMRIEGISPMKFSKDLPRIEPRTPYLGAQYLSKLSTARPVSNPEPPILGRNTSANWAPLVPFLYVSIPNDEALLHPEKKNTRMECCGTWNIVSPIERLSQIKSVLVVKTAQKLWTAGLSVQKHSTTCLSKPPNGTGATEEPFLYNRITKCYDI